MNTFNMIPYISYRHTLSYYVTVMKVSGHPTDVRLVSRNLAMVNISMIPSSTAPATISQALQSYLMMLKQRLVTFSSEILHQHSLWRRRVFLFKLYLYFGRTKLDMRNFKNHLSSVVKCPKIIKGIFHY